MVNSLCSVASVMTVKRQLEEFDVSSIKQNLNAIKNGVVTGLSPIKKSKRNENFESVSVVYEGVVFLALLKRSRDLFQARLNCI